jgi:hypothetical protein
VLRRQTNLQLLLVLVTLFVVPLPLDLAVDVVAQLQPAAVQDQLSLVLEQLLHPNSTYSSPKFFSIN